MHHGYVPGVISLQVMRDGAPQLAVLPLPLRTGTAVHVLFLLSSTGTFTVLLSVACVVTTGYTSGK